MTNIDVGQLKTQFECPKCAGSTVSVPSDESEGDWITCVSCGAQIITIENLNEEVRRVGSEMIRSKLRGEPDNAEFNHGCLKRG